MSIASRIKCGDVRSSIAARIGMRCSTGMLRSSLLRRNSTPWAAGQRDQLTRWAFKSPTLRRKVRLPLLFVSFHADLGA